MIQIKMLPDWSILNYLSRRRPDVPEHDFLKNVFLVNFEYFEIQKFWLFQSFGFLKDRIHE